MKKEFLLELGISEEVAAKIMTENGADIQNIERKLKDMTSERDNLSGQINTIQTQLKAFEGVDVTALKGEVVKLSGDLATAQAAHAAELAKMKRQGETKDFMSTLKFVNDETRDYYFDKLESALDDDANKGKSRKDLLDSFVNGEDGKPRANIFAEAHTAPEPMAPMNPAPFALPSSEPKSVVDKVSAKISGLLTR